jgi:hypothetical protein
MRKCSNKSSPHAPQPHSSPVTPGERVLLLLNHAQQSRKTEPANKLYSGDTLSKGVPNQPTSELIAPEGIILVRTPEVAPVHPGSSGKGTEEVVDVYSDV